MFDRYTKTKARNGRDWRLLFVDGHGSHLNMKFLDWCDQHRILVAIYPPHLTHRLQPLDVSLFSPLATYYSQELKNWISRCQTLCGFTKREFFSLFWCSFQRAFTPKNIASGRRKTGLYPFNPDIVLDQVKIRKTRELKERPLSRKSNSLVLSNTD